MTRGVLLSGMFRSGTTLLSRMLSAAPRSLIVADPFVYFFKAYRNYHLERTGATGWHPDQPTSDFFLSPTEETDRAILDADLSEVMPATDLAKLLADIRQWKSAQHPELCAKLDDLRGGTFADVYRQLIELCVDLYGSTTTELAGTKVSWSEEFLPALSRAFPDMRFVLLVRDLRAIVASQNAMQGAARGKRPLLFYVRHWRKSVAFTRRFAHHSTEFAGRVTVLRYEDIAREPSLELTRLAAFLGIPFDSAMIEAASFASVDGKTSWSPNSSFAGAGGGVYTDSIERWKGALSPAEIQALNALAGPELACMGYEVPAAVVDPIDCLGSGCEPAFDELAPWLQPFHGASYLQSDEAMLREYATESVRRAVLDGEFAGPSDQREGLFLDDDVLADLRATWTSRGTTQPASR